MSFKVAFCAGHGGFGVTPGKRTPDGEFEWNFNDEVAVAFEEAMNQYQGVELLRTDDRSGHTDVPLQTRTDKANAWKADIYISFHHNANTAQWGSWGGTETFNYKNTGDSLRLAKAVHPRVLAAYDLRDRGIKDGSDLWIIRKTNMPAILIEGGFMDSTTDIGKLRDHKVLKNAGYAVAEGAAEYAGLKKKESEAQPKTEIAQTCPGEIKYIYTGGYAGPTLLTIHDYLFRLGHGFDVKRGPDGSVIFLAGPFDTSQPNWKEAYDSIIKIDPNMHLYNPGQAADWRK